MGLQTLWRYDNLACKAKNGGLHEESGKDWQPEIQHGLHPEMR